jgi:hypothetical protein
MEISFDQSNLQEKAGMGNNEVKARNLSFFLL